MIADKTKCIIKSVSGDGLFAGLVGQGVTASPVEGERKTGTQQFKLDGGGYLAIYGNGDSGIVVVEKAA